MNIWVFERYEKTTTKFKILIPVLVEGGHADSNKRIQSSLALEL